MIGVLMFATVVDAQVRKLDDSDCDQFPSQEAAQDFLDSSDFPGAAGGGDVDADFDGVACDDYDYGASSPTATPSTAPTATPTASATGSATARASVAATSQYSAPSLPETGGFSPVTYLAPVALLVVGGLFAAKIVRRG
jgi:hypothetical protein